MSGPWDQFKSELAPAPAPTEEHGPWNEYKPTSVPTDANSPGLLESFGRGAAEGASFGFDDKLGMSKERREASKRSNPWTHFIGEIAGGVLPMIGTAGIGAAVKGAGYAAKGIRGAASLFNPGEISTLGQASTQGAKLGATYGGLSGAGHADVKDGDTYGDALEKRGSGALTGAAAGAVVGPALGAIGHGLYRGAQALGGMRAAAAAETDNLGSGALTTAVRRLERDRVTPQELITQIRSEFPDDTAAAGGIGKRFWGNATGNNKQPISADHVEEVVLRAMNGESAADISAALSPGGKGTGPGESAVKTLLDELAERHLGPLNMVDRAGMVRPGSGDNTQMTMRAAAATPGEAMATARESLLDRQIGAQGRLQNAIECVVGTSDLEGAAQANRTRFQDAAGKVYGKAFAEEKPFDLAPIFSNWENKFDQMRGVIPDSVRQRLNSMMWTGTDAAGNPTKTPPTTLQGFMYAREGLRDLVKELPQGNNLRRHLSNLYNEMTDEVATKNPAWKAANDLYRDGAAADEAIALGKQLATRQGAPSREALSALAVADRESAQASKAFNQAKKAYAKAGQRPTGVTADEQAAFELAKARFDAIDARQSLMRTAYAQNLTDAIANQGETHDLVRKMLLPGSKNIIGRVLGDKADPFIKTLQAEAAIHRTYKSQFGSQTTPLALHEAELNWAPRFEASMANPLTWGAPLMRLAQEYAARNINAKRNTDLMRLYTETDPLKQLESLRAMQQLHAARTTAGNAVGKPAIGLGSGVLPEALIATEQGQLYQPIKPYRPATP